MAVVFYEEDAAADRKISVSFVCSKNEWYERSADCFLWLAERCFPFAQSVCFLKMAGGIYNAGSGFQSWLLAACDAGFVRD